MSSIAKLESQLNRLWRTELIVVTETFSLAHELLRYDPLQNYIFSNI
jgi:hypothetical protein